MKPFVIPFDPKTGTWGSVTVHAFLRYEGRKQAPVPIMPQFEVRDGEQPGALGDGVYLIPKARKRVDSNNWAVFDVVVDNARMRTTPFMFAGPPGTTFGFDLDVALTPKVLPVPGSPVPVDLPMSRAITSRVRVNLEAPPLLIKVLPESDLVLDSGTGAAQKVTAACVAYDYRKGEYLTDSSYPAPSAKPGGRGDLLRYVTMADRSVPNSSVNVLMLAAKTFHVGNGKPISLGTGFSNDDWLLYVPPAGFPLKPVQKLIKISTQPIQARFQVYREDQNGKRVNLAAKTLTLTGSLVDVVFNVPNDRFRWNNLFLDVSVADSPAFYQASHVAGLQQIPITGDKLALDLRLAGKGEVWPNRCQVEMQLPAEEATGLWLLTIGKVGWVESGPLDVKPVCSPQQLSELLAQGGRLIVHNPIGVFEPIEYREGLLYATGALQVKESLQVPGKDADGTGKVVFEIKGETSGEVGPLELPIDMGVLGSKQESETTLKVETTLAKNLANTLGAAAKLDEALSGMGHSGGPTMDDSARAYVQACLTHLAKKGQDDIKSTYAAFAERVLTVSTYLELTSSNLAGLNLATSLRTEIFQRQISNWMNAWLEFLFFFGEKGFNKVADWKYGISDQAEYTMEVALRKEWREGISETVESSKKALTRQLDKVDDAIKAAGQRKAELVEETRTVIEDLKKTLSELQELERKVLTETDEQVRVALQKQLDDKLAGAPLEKPFLNELELIRLERELGSREQQKKTLGKFIDQCDQIRAAEPAELDKILEQLANSGKAESLGLDQEVDAIVKELVAGTTAFQVPTREYLAESLSILKNIKSPSPQNLRSLRLLEATKQTIDQELEPARVKEWFRLSWKTDFLAEVGQNEIQQLGQTCIEQSRVIPQEMRSMANKPRYRSISYEHYEGFLAPAWYFFDVALERVHENWDAFVEYVGPFVGSIQTWLLSCGWIKTIADEAVSWGRYLAKKVWELIDYVLVQGPAWFAGELQQASPASTSFAQRVRDIGLEYAYSKGLNRKYTDFYPKQAQALADATANATTPPGQLHANQSGVNVQAGADARAAARQETITREVDSYKSTVKDNSSFAATLYVTLCQEALDPNRITEQPPVAIDRGRQFDVATGFLQNILSEVRKYRPAIDKQDDDLIAWLGGIWGDVTIGNLSWSSIENTIEAIGFTFAWVLRGGAVVGMFSGIGAPAGATMLLYASVADAITAGLLVAVGHFGALRFMNGITLDLVIAQSVIHKALFTGGLDLYDAMYNTTGEE